jgi:hypothetical protein
MRPVVRDPIRRLRAARLHDALGMGCRSWARRSFSGAPTIHLRGVVSALLLLRDPFGLYVSMRVPELPRRTLSADAIPDGRCPKRNKQGERCQKVAGHPRKCWFVVREPFEAMRVRRLARTRMVR